MTRTDTEKSRLLNFFLHYFLKAIFPPFLVISGASFNLPMYHLYHLASLLFIYLSGHLQYFHNLSSAILLKPNFPPCL